MMIYFRCTVMGLLILMIGCSGEELVDQSEARVLVELPTVVLDKDGTPTEVVGKSGFETPTMERLRVKMVIDASSSDLKPRGSAVFKVLGNRQGKTVTADSTVVGADKDHADSKYTYLGEIEAPNKPGDYLLVVKLKGKELCRQEMHVTEATE